LRSNEIVSLSKAIEDGGTIICSLGLFPPLPGKMLQKGHMVSVFDAYVIPK